MSDSERNAYPVTLCLLLSLGVPSLSRVNRIRLNVCSLGPDPSCSRVSRHGADPAATFEIACSFSAVVQAAWRRAWPWRPAP
jgi:hypothetical protein